MISYLPASLHLLSQVFRKASSRSAYSHLCSIFADDQPTSLFHSVHSPSLFIFSHRLSLPFHTTTSPSLSNWRPVPRSLLVQRSIRGPFFSRDTDLRPCSPGTHHSIRSLSTPPVCLFLRVTVLSSPNRTTFLQPPIDNAFPPRLRKHSLPLPLLQLALSALSIALRSGSLSILRIYIYTSLYLFSKGLPIDLSFST